LVNFFAIDLLHCLLSFSFLIIQTIVNGLGRFSLFFELWLFV